MARLCTARAACGDSRANSATARGMAAWVENGDIRLLDLRTGEMFFIRLNCQQIERMAIYDTRGPSLTSEQIRQEVERDYCLRV